MHKLSRTTIAGMVAVHCACLHSVVAANDYDAAVAGAANDNAEVTLVELRPVNAARSDAAPLAAGLGDWVSVTDSVGQSGLSGAAEVVFSEVAANQAPAVTLTETPLVETAQTVVETVESEAQVLLTETPVRATQDAADTAESTVAAVKTEEVVSTPGRHVILSNVEFEGNTVIDDATLGQVAAPFVGRRIGLSDLEELRIQLTQAYVKRGYLNSGAILPDQKVEAGNIVFSVIEGTLADLNIEGEGDLREKYISERVLRDAAEPFNSFALQENFQLLLDDPLIDRMDGQLQALPEPGRTALNLRVTRARPYDFSITGSNHGALSLGSQQMFLNGTLRNLSGRGDELGITVGGNQNKYNVSSVYELPISSEETRVKASVSIADSTVVEEPFDSIDIDSQTLGADISISRSLKRSVNGLLTVGTGFALRENKNTLSGEPFSFSSGEEDGRSRVAVARIWQDLIRRGSKDVLAFRSTLNMGLDMFGSTMHDGSRPDSEFFTLQGQFQYARRYLDDRAQLLLKVDAQLASTELLPLERFALGGATSVRGYRENELVRDDAVLASVEFRYPFFRSGDFGTFQLAPFLDVGYGRNKNFFKADEKLASVGLGILWSLRSRFSGELYFGSVLRDRDSRDGSSLQERGIHLKLVAKL